MKKIIDKVKTSKKLQIILVVVVLLIAFIIYSAGNMRFNSLDSNASKKANSVTSETIDDLGYGDSYYSESYYDDEADGEEYIENKSLSEDSKSGHNFVSAEDENQKLVYSGNVEIRSENVDKTYDELIKLMNKYDGKIENLSQYNSSITIDIRILKDNFMKLYNELNDVPGDITSSDLNIDDKTKQYSDNSRRIDVLKTEYDELKDLMKEAQNLEEILELKDRLTELSYEIESYEQSNATIDYDAKYSTLTIRITKYSSGSFESIPFGQQIKEAFHDSIEFIKAFIIFLVTIWFFIFLILLFIFRKKIKKLFKRNKKNVDNLESEVVEAIEDTKEELKE